MWYLIIIINNVAANDKINFIRFDMVDKQKSLVVIASQNENSINFVLLACGGSKKKYCVMYGCITHNALVVYSLLIKYGL